MLGGSGLIILGESVVDPSHNVVFYKGKEHQAIIQIHLLFSLEFS